MGTTDAAAAADALRHRRALDGGVASGQLGHRDARQRSAGAPWLRPPSRGAHPLHSHALHTPLVSRPTRGQAGGTLLATGGAHGIGIEEDESP